jgi:hypothetical protein
MQARNLESELFGGVGDLVDHLDTEAQIAEASQPFSIAAYVRDAATDGVTESDKEVAVSGEKSAASKAKRRAVWVDADDADKSVDIAAVPRLRKLRKGPEEALLAGMCVRM